MLTMAEKWYERLRRAREELGWTHSELARRAKVSRPQIINIEAGEVRFPRRETLIAITEALGLDYFRLYAQEPDITTENAPLSRIMHKIAALLSQEQITDLEPQIEVWSTLLRGDHRKIYTEQGRAFSLGTNKPKPSKEHKPHDPSHNGAA